MTFDKLAWQRKQRKLTSNHDVKKYEKTKNGFLMRCYRNMLSRVTGVTKKKNHLYLGKEILDKKSFYDWSLSDSNFNNLFSAWNKSDHVRKLTPSIDRIDPNIGYNITNIRWITHSENSMLTRRNKII